MDSALNADQLTAYFRERGLRLKVLVELGVPGGRCGIRDDSQLKHVLDALDGSRGVVDLCGVELYEGVLTDEESIRSFLRRTCEVTKRLEAEGRFARTPALMRSVRSAPAN